MIFQKDCQNYNSNKKLLNKIKVFKMGCQIYFTKIQRMKNIQSTIKLIKIGKRPGTTYCFGCKDYMQNFRPEKVKMTNKVLREKSHNLMSRGF